MTATESIYELARKAGHHTYHFYGGLRLRHHKQISCQSPVEKPSLPPYLSVPLQQHAGEVAEAVVDVGDQVLKGQVIGRHPGCASIHAPVSGSVTARRDLPISDPSGKEGPCIVIQPDGEEQWVKLEAISDWSAASPEQLIKQMRECGLAGLGGAVFPSHVKAEVARKQQVHTLIINGAECEPYISCDEMLMREQPDKIVLGARILRRALGAERIVIAIEDQMGAVQVALEHAVAQSECPSILVVRVNKIYPEGGEKQLVQVLTSLQVPAGGLPCDLGLVCYNVATAAAVSDAVVAGRPLIERYVTVTGNGLVHPRNLLALIGTPFAHLIEACDGYRPGAARLVVGGPMMGFPVASDASPVVKAVNCVLVLTKQDIATPQTEMPCIRCGECARVCPAQLLPQQLHLQTNHGLWTQAEEYGLSACIECGCCDFVCPSHIPLTSWFRYGKVKLQERAVAAATTRRTRKRYEARATRLVREQTEQAEKMQQRKHMLTDRPGQQQGVKAAIERAARRNKTAGDTDDT